jgi:aminoglycoside phosphotransferase (APT) family kinase protein
VGGAFIARFRKQPHEHTTDTLEREAALLEMLSRISPLPIPQVVAAEPAAGLIVYRRLPGRSLFEKPVPEPGAIAEALANFMAAIHGVPSGTVEHLVERDEYPLNGYLTDAAALMQQVTT